MPILSNTKNLIIVAKISIKVILIAFVINSSFIPLKDSLSPFPITKHIKNVVGADITENTLSTAL